MTMSKKCTLCHEVQAGADVNQVRAIVAAASPALRTTELPGRIAYSGKSRYRTAPTIERHCRLQPHIQQLLGPMEIARCEEWITRALLEIR